MAFMATKGIEYLLVLAYLALLIPAWKLLTGSRARPPATPLGGSPGRSWFQIPRGLFYHPGHTWVRPREAGLLRVGVDDFAYHLVGPPDGIELPDVGERLEAGEPGLGIRVGSRTIPLLAPVTGRVEAVNREALASPTTAASDPYDRGWLLEVRVPSVGATLRNLLPHGLAVAWTEEASEELSSLLGRELGVVLADGGSPVPGLARTLAGDEWPQLAARLLHTGALEAEPTVADGGAEVEEGPVTPEVG
jgi:glycine cleavage system H lipoate-binding protein